MTSVINFVIKGDDSISHHYQVPCETIRNCGELSKLYIDSVGKSEEVIGLESDKNSKRCYISFEYLINYLNPSFKNDQNYNSLDHFWILEDILIFLGITTDDLIEYYLNENGIPSLYSFTNETNISDIDNSSNNHCHSAFKNYNTIHNSTNDKYHNTCDKNSNSIIRRSSTNGSTIDNSICHNDISGSCIYSTNTSHSNTTCSSTTTNSTATIDANINTTCVNHKIIKLTVKDVLNGSDYLTTKSHYNMLVGNCLITKPATLEQIKMYQNANWLEPTRFTKCSTMTMIDYRIKIWLDTAIKMCQKKK